MATFLNNLLKQNNICLPESSVINKSFTSQIFLNVVPATSPSSSFKTKMEAVIVAIYSSISCLFCFSVFRMACWTDMSSSHGSWSVLRRCDQAKMSFSGSFCPSYFRYVYPSNLFVLETKGGFSACAQIETQTQTRHSSSCQRFITAQHRVLI